MIGIFDSGVGCLSVFKYLKKELPDISISCLSDQGRFPYGKKNKKTKIRFSYEDALFLRNKKAKLIIVGCNSISSYALEYIRKRIDIPVIDMILPLFKMDAFNGCKRVGIIGSGDTVSSNIYLKLLRTVNPKIKVFQQEANLLIYLVEENIRFNSTRTALLGSAIQPLIRNDIDTLVLACTHFSFLEQKIALILPKHIKILDPSKVIAKYIKYCTNINYKDSHSILSTLYTTGDIEQFKRFVYKNLNHDTYRVKYLNRIP